MASKGRRTAKSVFVSYTDANLIKQGCLGTYGHTPTFDNAEISFLCIVKFQTDSTTAHHDKIAE